MAFCVKCGTNVNSEMRFCPKCGAEQGAAAAGAQGPARRLRSMASGEGVGAEYTDPDTIYLQTRNLQAFTGQLIPLLPTQNAGGFRLG